LTLVNTGSTHAASKQEVRKHTQFLSIEVKGLAKVLSIKEEGCNKVRTENHKHFAQKIDTPSAVDVSIGHGASDGPRGSSPAINEV
ncbi:unnamed protein product, partial [Arabidopsis halleri]